MTYVKTRKQFLRFLIKCAAIIAAALLIGSASRAQDSPTRQQPESTWSQDLNKYPGLMPELGRLADKLQHNIQFPAPREETRLLSLLPQSTMSFAAFPNYGDTAEQVLNIFRQELQESAVLRDWWQHGPLAANGPKVEDYLEKFSQFHQFLGEEIVVSGAFDGHDPRLLVVAPIRKPGLKKYLQQMLAQLSTKSKPGVRVLDLQDLAAAEDNGKADELLVLVRPDFVLASGNLATLRAFNSRLANKSQEFVPTPFAQRVLQEYQGGLTVLAAADLHNILNQIPTATRQDASFQHSGFADIKYVVWEHRTVSGQAISQMELSFNSPRHGAAAWLANSTPLTSLDFVSPKAMMAATVVLGNPAQIFDDVKDLAGPSNSRAFAMIGPAENALKLSLKDDLLNLLGGEITIELDSLAPPGPVWKAILAVKDSDHLQQTLHTLLATTNFEADPVEEDGVTYHLLHIPNEKTTIDISYALVDSHLLLGSSREVLAEAVRLHRSGESLGKSKKFLAALPPGRSLKASALLYQDPIAITALQLQRLSPELAHSFAQNSKDSPPAVVGVYGDEKTIREASISPSFDAAAVLVVAAVAIPNLLRSRMAANEASAVGSLRSVNTAQVAYVATYPDRGYAPNLARLGVDPRGPDSISPDHAGLLDQSLASESCTADAWCVKSGYRFRVTALCKKQLCSEYVSVATPVSGETGTRNFCSASDAVIHSKVGSPLTSALTASECKAWPPLQ